MRVSAPLAAIVPHPEDEEIRRRLADVLARPEFADKPQRGWFDAFARRLIELFRWLGGLQEGSPVLFWLILIGCFVLLLLLLAHIVWTLRQVFIVPGRRRRDREAAAEHARQSRAHWEEALRCAGRGEFTEAIRRLFLSLVYRYDESGRVSFQRACTNWEYLALVRDRPDVQSRLAVFVETLDAYWYGQRPAERPQYEYCLHLYEQMQ